MLERSKNSRRVRRYLVRAVRKAIGGAVLGIVLFGASAIHSGADAMAVGPGEAFEINFTFPSAPMIPGGAVDTLVLTAAGAHLSGPGIPVAAQLFDGGALLGNGDDPSSALFAFTAPMSLFAGVPANLDSVVDGSIVGQIRLTPDFPGGVGFIDFSMATLIVEAVRATSERGVVRGQQFATVAPTKVVDAARVSAVPLPASLALLFSALAVLGIFVWRRSKFVSTSRYNATYPSSVT